MRSSLVLLTLFLLALPAAAQLEPAPSITAGQEAALVGSAVLATAGSAWLLLRASESLDSPLPFLALPVVPPATVCAVGSAMDLGGECGQAFRSAFFAALPGYALIGVGLSMQTWDGLGFVFFGALGLLIPPPFAAADSYRRSITPAVVADPVRGTAMPGLHLRLRF